MYFDFIAVIPYCYLYYVPSFQIEENIIYFINPRLPN